MVPLELPVRVVLSSGTVLVAGGGKYRVTGVHDGGHGVGSASPRYLIELRAPFARRATHRLLVDTLEYDARAGVFRPRGAFCLEKVA